MKVLLVEDDVNFGTVLKNYLELHRYKVQWAKNGFLGYSAYKSFAPDICILDVMMAEKDGFTLAKEIRAENQEVPVVFLTAKSLKEDMVYGFKTGADDYLTKPFDPDILILKIEAILKRKKSTALPPDIPELCRIGRYTYRPVIRELEINGTKRSLTPKENELLKLLYAHREHFLPRETALKSIWKEDNYFTTRSMDVYLAKLRKYLKEDENVQIVNLQRSGFRLEIS